MHANEYSHLRPTCRHTKMDHGTHTPHMHSILLGPGTTTPRGVVSARSGAKPPSLRRGDRKTTPVPAAAEKITAQTPTGRPAHPHSPRPQTENREQGLWEKKKKKKDPMLHPTRSNVVLVCVVLRCFKTGVLLKQGRGTLHKLVSARPLPRALNVYVQLKIEKWALAPEGRLNEQTALRMPFSVPTPKALYVCVMWQ